MIFTLLFPSLLTWCYFIALADSPTAVQQGIYAAGKLLQFGFPVIFVVLIAHEPLRFRWRWREGLIEGVLSGLALLTSVAVLWFFLSQTGSEILGSLVITASAKVTDLGIDTPVRYAAVGLFYSVVHTFLEEYYWRWFLYGRLRARTSQLTATVVSSLGFMAHHVILMSFYTGWDSPWTYVFSFAVAIGGAYWAWLYERSETLAAPWVSHFFVDVAIFSVGWALLK
jgi:membrane protease YdiL (CAAX protease family)